MIGHISEPKHMTAKALFVSYTLSKSEKLFTNIWNNFFQFCSNLDMMCYIMSDMNGHILPFTATLDHYKVEHQSFYPL